MSVYENEETGVRATVTQDGDRFKVVLLDTDAGQLVVVKWFPTAAGAEGFARECV